VKNMEIEKYIAALLAGLMAVSTFVGAALASNLSGFPEFLFTKTATASSPAYLVVVGADAKTSDIVGAIDLASRLAEGSYTIETVTGAAAVAAVTGVERDTIGLYEALSTNMPSSGVMQNFHYSGLKDSTFTWRG
jgi:S-layer protein (TIGR01564 family)